MRVEIDESGTDDPVRRVDDMRSCRNRQSGRRDPGHATVFHQHVGGTIQSDERIDYPSGPNEERRRSKCHRLSVPDTKARLRSQSGTAPGEGARLYRRRDTLARS